MGSASAGLPERQEYPMILDIHGGPPCRYGYVSTMNSRDGAKGYIAVSNPRGSTTYGQDFGNIISTAIPVTISKI